MDWDELRNDYISDFQKNNLPLRDWCDQKNIKYNTARRYIKVQTLKTNHMVSPSITECAPGNKSALPNRHKGYSQYIAPKYVDAVHSIHSLHYELMHARSMLAHQSDRLGWFNDLMDEHAQLEDKLSLFKSMTPLYDLIDRTMGRIANLENSIAKLEYMRINIEKEEVQKELLLQTLNQRRQSAENGYVAYDINW